MSGELLRAADGALSAAFDGIERLAGWATLGNGAGLALSVTTMASILEIAPDRVTPVPAILFLLGIISGALARACLSGVRYAVAGEAVVEHKNGKAEYAKRKRLLISMFQFSIGVALATFVAACCIAIYAVS